MQARSRGAFYILLDVDLLAGFCLIGRVETVAADDEDPAVAGVYPASGAVGVGVADPQTGLIVPLLRALADSQQSDASRIEYDRSNRSAAGNLAHRLSAGNFPDANRAIVHGAG